MRFTINRESLLKPLQLVAGVVERKQAVTILSHVLLSVYNKQLQLVGTDVELEMQGFSDFDGKVETEGAVTLPGKKFLEICRALPEQSELEIIEENNRIIVSSGRSRFNLVTLPCSEFPRFKEEAYLVEISIKNKELKSLLEKTAFAIPQQDIRQYLNGLLFEIKDGSIQVIATDGHRLAMNSIEAPVVDNSFAQIIIPRKGVFELMRLVDDSDDELLIRLNNNHISVKGDEFCLLSNLISGKFPNYNKIIPKYGDKRLEFPRNDLKQVLTRVSVLTNEVFRSVSFQLRPGILCLMATNPEQEEAVEELPIDYQGENIDAVFNIGYLLDVLNCMTTELVCIFLRDNDGGIIMEEVNGKSNCLYVVMPIRQ